jgi:hypothetical protein
VGFPPASNGLTTQLSQISIVLCGNNVTTYTSIDFGVVSFIIPPNTSNIGCNSSNLNNSTSFVNVNGYIRGFAFTYNSSLDPTITSLSPKSASPIIKQPLTIRGTNFNGLLT